MDMNKLNNLDLRNRVIKTSVIKKQRSASKKSHVYGLTSPQLEFVSSSNNNNHQLTEDIDSDYEEHYVREAPKSPVRTSIINDQYVYLNQNSPSSTQFISSSPNNSASAKRASIINQNDHGRLSNEPNEQVNVVDMIKMMMLQLNSISSRTDSISSRMDMFEQNRVVPEAITKVPLVESAQTYVNPSSINISLR